MYKLFSISLDILRRIFEINRIITGHINALSRTFIPVDEINKGMTDKIKKQIHEIMSQLLISYNQDKTAFTQNIATCISNIISNISNNPDPSNIQSNIPCDIEQIGSIIKLLKPLLTKKTIIVNGEEVPNQKSIESYGLVWASILTKAIQELKAENNSLQCTINLLKSCIGIV